MLRFWVGAGVLLALMAAVQGGSSASYGIPVGDLEARAIVGGAEDCGNKWKSGSVSCAAGTVLCGTEAQACATQTHASLVTDGAGSEVEKTSSQASCFVCNGCVCSKATKVTDKKEAECDDE